MCENLYTEGIITDIFKSPTGCSIMIRTKEGYVTVPVKDIGSFKFNQKLIVSIQVSSNE